MSDAVACWIAAANQLQAISPLNTNTGKSVDSEVEDRREDEHEHGELRQLPDDRPRPAQQREAVHRRHLPPGEVHDDVDEVAGVGTRGAPDAAGAGAPAPRSCSCEGLSAALRECRRMADDPGAVPSDDGAVTVDLVELDGRGGPYQHAVAVAEEVERSGVHVVLHTARDAELVPGAGVEVCRCMDWLRDAGHGRPARVAARFFAVTVPHLLRGHGVLHVQGPFKAWLLAALLARARCARPARRVQPAQHVLAPRRRAGRPAVRAVRAARARHDRVLGRRRADGRLLGATPVVSPLLQHLPPVDPARVAAWRSSWAAAPGRALRGSDPQREAARRGRSRPAGCGRGRAGWRSSARTSATRERCRGSPRASEPTRRGPLDYFELDDVRGGGRRRADVVVCPYSRASQSGVARGRRPARRPHRGLRRRRPAGARDGGGPPRRRRHRAGPRRSTRCSRPRPRARAGSRRGDGRGPSARLRAGLSACGGRSSWPAAKGRGCARTRRSSPSR